MLIQLNYSLSDSDELKRPFTVEGKYLHVAGTKTTPEQCFIQRGWGALGFPTQLRFPPQALPILPILCITFPPQWHQVLHLLETVILYETLYSTGYFRVVAHSLPADDAVSVNIRLFCSSDSSSLGESSFSIVFSFSVSESSKLRWGPFSVLPFSLTAVDAVAFVIRSKFMRERERRDKFMRKKGRDERKKR